MQIHSERPGDEAAIRRVNVAAFPSPDEATLVDRLRDAGRLPVSLVAVADGGDVVGHVGFSPVTAASGAVGAGLAPLAVLPAEQGRGFGTALVEAGLERCASLGFGWAVVLGEPGYYGRFGFRPASEFGLVDEYGGGEAFQAIELAPGQVPVGAGLVRFAEEFADL